MKRLNMAGKTLKDILMGNSLGNQLLSQPNSPRLPKAQMGKACHRLDAPGSNGYLNRNGLGKGNTFTDGKFGKFGDALDFQLSKDCATVRLNRLDAHK